MKRRQFRAATAALAIPPSPPRKTTRPSTSSPIRPRPPRPGLHRLVTRNHGFLVFDQLYDLDDTLQSQPQRVDGHAIEDGGRTRTIHAGLQLQCFQDVPYVPLGACNQLNSFPIFYDSKKG